MQELHKLDEKTARVLRKELVVTGVADVVRELVENAIDAEAKRIQVHLDNYGMKRIEVRDDGHGIPTFSLKYVVNGGYTSKASTTNNLSCDGAYGFRGEALSGICSAGNLTITSKSGSETHALRVEFDQYGKIKGESNVAHNNGTTVLVTDLFSRSPVRSKYLNALPQLVIQLREVEHFLKAVSIVNFQCQITLVHNGNSIWTKPMTYNIEQAFCAVLGLSISKHLEKCKSIEEATQPESERVVNKMDLYVPRLPIDRVMFCSTNKMTMIYVNKKAVKIKEFEKTLKERICSLPSASQGSASKYPVCVLSIVVPSQNVDFNRDLDKQKVFLVHKEEILEKMKGMLDAFYPTNRTPTKEIQEVEALKKSSASEKAGSEPISSKNNTLEEKQNNIMNFLNEIPVAEPLNFTRSPSKGLPSPLGSKINAASFDQTFDKPPELRRNLISPSSTTSACSLIQPSNGLTSALMDKSVLTTTSDINLNDRDWVHGRMTDKLGNIIESTILVRADPRPALADDGLAFSRPRSAPMPLTSPRASAASALQSFGQAPVVTQRIVGKRFESPGYRNELPQKRRRFSDGLNGEPLYSQSQCGTPSSCSTMSERTLPSVAKPNRQVTLETLRNWPTPGNAFAKTNTVHSITQPSPSRLFEKSSKSTAQNAKLATSTPKPPSSNNASSTENQRQPLINSFLNEREMLRTGTLGLRRKIPVTPHVFRYKDRQEHQQMNSESDASLPVVIGKLGSESPLYVVKINTMLGVLSPTNLLDMEPNLKQKLNVEQFDSQNLTTDLIQALATEFSQLSYEDYEEDQVKRVFSCLKDFSLNETEDSSLSAA